MAEVFENPDFLRWFKRMKEILAHLTAEEIFDLLDSEVRLPPEERHNELTSREYEKFLSGAPNRFDLEFYSGHPCLKAALSRWTGVRKEQFVISNGATAAMVQACRAAVQPDCDFVIETPTYQPFCTAARLAGASRIHRWVRSSTFDTDGLAELLSKLKRPRALIVSNLQNPTGWSVPEGGYKALADLARTLNLIVIVDEIFRDLAPPFGAIPRPAATMDPCFISLSSLSKVYGRSDVRCGWIISSEPYLERVIQAESDIENCLPAHTQGLASLWVDELPAHRDRALRRLRENRVIAENYLQPLINQGLLEGELPPYSSVYFPKIAGIRDDEQFVEQLAASQAVYLVPGSLFASPGHVRIGLGGNPETLDEGLRRFATAVRRR